MLADLETINKKIEKLQKDIKSRDKNIVAQKELANKVKAHLDAEYPVRTLVIEEEEKELLKNFFLITAKPVLYACNVGDSDLPEMNNNYVKMVIERANKENSHAIPI